MRGGQEDSRRNTTMTEAPARMMRSRSSTRCEINVCSTGSSLICCGSLTPALCWDSSMEGKVVDAEWKRGKHQKNRVGRRSVSGVCLATRAAPDWTRVLRNVVRLYQFGMAVCLTLQFLRVPDGA